MRWLDRDFAHCTPLKLLAFLGEFVGAPLGGERGSIFNACTAVFFRQRVLPRSLQRSEQNRCCRARRATSRPQTAQVTGASRRTIARVRIMASPFPVTPSPAPYEVARGRALVVGPCSPRWKRGAARCIS
jgi:hypothetical protein